jgi:hypothetical protein
MASQHTIIQTSGKDLVPMLGHSSGDTQIPNKYKTITTAKTEPVSALPCILSSILVQGGTAGTITVYDNTSASGSPVINFDATNALNNYIVNVEMTVGLTVVTSAATKLTIFYKTI